MGELFGLLEFGPGGWGDELALGALLTVELAAAVVPIGIVFGLLVALARDSKFSVLRIPANAFTTVFRGLPELLTLFIVYFGGQILIQNVVSLFSDTYVELSAFVAGVIALGMVFAAFAGEVFLGAITPATTHSNYIEAYYPDAKVKFYGTQDEANLDLASGFRRARLPSPKKPAQASPSNG